MNDKLSLIIWLLLTFSLTGCQNTSEPFDYTNFIQADPHSILVLPPINNSHETLAPYSVMAQVAAPIAEAGFYVFPTTLVTQTFNNNGLTIAEDIHQLPVQSIHDIFGADAALYITIEEYGTGYMVISSETQVALTAQLIDLRTGDLLWQNTAYASSAEQQNNNSGLVGALVMAVVSQVVDTLLDRGFDIADICATRLLSPTEHQGLLYGHRSTKYGQTNPSETQP